MAVLGHVLAINILSDWKHGRDAPCHAHMKKLKKIYVEVTNTCNLACSFCPGTNRRPGTMTPNAFDAILGKIRPFTDHLHLHVMGEPLLHPQFPDLLARCEAHGFRVNLATNAVLLKRHSNTLLTSTAIRQIDISLHCLDLQAGSPVIPKTYLDDILEFIAASWATSGIYISLRLWNAWPGKPINTALAERIESFFTLAEKLSNLPPGTNAVPLAPRVFLNLAEPFAWPEIHPDLLAAEGRAFCRGLRDHCAILVDGTVIPCCLDRNGIIALGNVHDAGLDAILRGSRARAMAQGFGEGKAVEPLCARCEFRRRFA
jgi:MoaA/NifB/PqqE/SkfB family radical SAM enzyme